jgi:hypothetical protein
MRLHRQLKHKKIPGVITVPIHATLKQACTQEIVNVGKLRNVNSHWVAILKIAKALLNDYLLRNGAAYIQVLNHKIKPVVSSTVM